MFKECAIDSGANRAPGVIRRWLCSMVLLLSGVSCAYHAGPLDRQIPGGYREIAVPVFRNITPETGVEVYFTNAFIRALERSRVGRVASQNDSQVTLEGNIDSIQYSASNPNKSGFLLLNREYRIYIKATLVLRRNSDKTILWQDVFTSEGSYSTPRIQTEGLNSANALYNHSARYQNIQTLATDMMNEAHDRLTENF